MTSTGTSSSENFRMLRRRSTASKKSMIQTPLLLSND
jgi:hypothetical protein